MKFPHVQTRKVDLVIVGGGLGGIACAISACTLGLKVILVEELDWLGGQLTSQGIPLDEHLWVETLTISRSYTNFRDRVRKYYLDNLPLSFEGRKFPINPGRGAITSLCHDPRVAVRVFDDMLAPHEFNGNLTILRNYQIRDAHVAGDRITAIDVVSKCGEHSFELCGAIFVDASETGELIEKAGIEHVTGAEAASETGELHALDQADPLDQQGFTWPFAVDYINGEDHTISKPSQYDFWREYRPLLWPGPLLSFEVLDHHKHTSAVYPLFDGNSDSPLSMDLWHFRRIAARKSFEEGYLKSDISVMCGYQNEYWLKPAIGVPPEQGKVALEESRQLSLSFLYWLQTEAPRHDGGYGYKGLRLRGDALGTLDGLAKQPYFREGRRIKSQFTLLEQHIGFDARPGATSAEHFRDSIGLGCYRINIHATKTRDVIDIPAFPYQLPLGMLLPIRMQNILPACCKSVGTTRVTNGSVRHHPIEWFIGEAVGALAAYSVANSLIPHQVREDQVHLTQFQRTLNDLGIILRWPAFEMRGSHILKTSWADYFHRGHGPNHIGYI
ncbi:FAD-dependent oxidoreductase [Microvirga zambiensis]|uniref:FAD-dependent oxidoreductase n=1 Tax=Microvirga zambiensis TaxID=1402137 RepID=UPI00192011B7|nr:FAD-dependent oxidoreductase [Microvirga zambiensis]